MVRPPKTHHPEEDIEEEADYGDDFPPRQDSSLRAGEAGRIDGKKANTPRSKHSETEQRRRSKINERFQILRDLIPQNDTKRDKASFLLEVIEYIQFLREKLQVYEGSYHGYNQEPSKLTPWRNNSVPVESHVDHTQVMKNGVGHENSIIVNPEMVITNAQNSLGSDLENASVPTQMQFGSVSSIENVASHSESQLWQVMPFTADCAAPNISQDQHEQLSIESGTVSLSSAYSQGILNTLTQALQSSGVDMSQARISVEVDVGKRMGNAAAGTSSLKDRESSQEAGVQGYTRRESDIRLHKRHRAENS